MSAEWQRNVLCRYFMMGACQRGEECPYSHDRTISNKGTIPCRFYQAGTCANGDNCRFSHGDNFQQQQQQLLLLEGQEHLSEQELLLMEGQDQLSDQQLLLMEGQDQLSVEQMHLMQDDHQLAVQANTALTLDPCQDPNCLEDYNPPAVSLSPQLGYLPGDHHHPHNTTSSSASSSISPGCLLGPATSMPTPSSTSTTTYIVYAPVYQTSAAALSPVAVSVGSCCSSGEAPHMCLSPLQTSSAMPGLVSPIAATAIEITSPTIQGIYSSDGSFISSPPRYHLPAVPQPVITLTHNTTTPGEVAASMMPYSSHTASVASVASVATPSASIVPASATVDNLPPSSTPSASVASSDTSLVASNLNPSASEFNSSLGNSTSSRKEKKDRTGEREVPTVSFTNSSSSSSSGSSGEESFGCTTRLKSVDDFPQFVPLSRRGQKAKKSADWNAPTNWAEAPEFVPKVAVPAPPPKQKSWAQVVNSGLSYPGCEVSVSEAESNLCPYYRVGECRYGEGCVYIHGVTCDYCGNATLHPTHLDQRRSHLAECLRQHERDMELSFAVARSKEKTCGICMEVVLDKPKGEARFGILPSCNHCFCLPCIRKWRQAKQFEHKIIRACPECRQTSDFICPSRYWVETLEEKDKLLTDYKKNLGLKECKYFNKGSGECPFGNKCFYKHEDKDGRVIDVGPPKKPVRRANADGSLSLVQRLLLYDFLEERDGQLVFPLDFVELFDLYSDDEWSDGDE